MNNSCHDSVKNGVEKTTTENIYEFVKISKKEWGKKEENNKSKSNLRKTSNTTLKKRRMKKIYLTLP